ncbi:hypothetical protein HUZ43_12610 [Raoultella ornithinolytica]|uniref:hypothetical protein n=1 Tax=Raoultella ornithinolytica TaxID=54291 RepID=UPI001EF89FFF|nr:hypothetical protein [Raoultella ornithinolytica]ULI44900.1 hypothetical protein HUZ43_12610 [Raoultella ornithinolytica]HDX8325352.1 hypothetical protein [Raoultella ornithinolytica]HDX8337143.1 hypothetical protein [Raoultella ornithinolytica]
MFISIPARAASLELSKLKIISLILLSSYDFEYRTDFAMRRLVPPGGISQLTTDTGSFFSTPLRETSGTALTEPRAHSRIHRIAKPVGS